MMNEVVSYLQEHYHVRTAGDVTWGHAINSKERLDQYLNNPEIMMLEADIRISSQGYAIAAHPPMLESDLSFEELLHRVSTSKQGLKLDFKDPEILFPCLMMLREADLKQPVLLNADILQGNMAASSKFNAAGFIAACQNVYPRGILSVGWTTYYDPENSYTRENVDEMLALCANVEQITFPVLSHFLPNSWAQMERLIGKDGYSLTIWGGPVDEQLHKWLIENTDPRKTFYDVFSIEGKELRF
jgi:Uncharacterized conserved protein (DUF2181)